MNFDFTFGKSPATNPPTPETPFRILVLGDLDGRGSRNLAQPLSGRRPVPVDLDSFEPFLKRLHAEVQLAGADPVRLAAGELEDLHPDHLFERMDLFAALRGTRQRLLNPATFATAAAEVRAWGGAVPSPIPVAAPGGPPISESNAGILERLLGHAPAPAASGGAAEELIRTAVTPYIVAAPASDRPALVAAVEAAAAELMRGVLHDPAFQALEAAWRGLDFLVRHLEINESLTVSVLNLSRTELLADVMGAENLAPSALFRLLVEGTVESPGADPWALVLGLYEFDQSPADRELLERVAKLARAAGAPFVAAAGAGLWQTVLQNPGQLAADQAWKAWRSSPEAAWLGLTGPRFLLRQPYGKATDPIAAFAFEELAGPHRREDYLWGHPALALGVLLGQMFTESGWEMSPRGSLELGGLPVHSWKEGTETHMTPCAECWLRDTEADRLVEHGLMPFQSIQGRDAIRLAGVLSLHLPTQGLAGRWPAES